MAEDNIVNQKVACGILRRQGWSVALAVNGNEAIREFVDGEFDLILMDIQMPEMDGLEATRIIRQTELRRAMVGRCPRIPIIALTAHASKTQHDQCIESGMDAVITKPIDIHLLLGRIREVLRLDRHIDPVTQPDRD